MPNSPVGVDISNTHLDVYVGPAGQAARVPNDAAGFTALIAWVEVSVRAVTDEPTGRWHRAFEEALLEAGLPLVRVNPLNARRFAQAIGQRAKTDALVKDRTAALTRQTQGRHRLLKQSHKNRLAQLDRHLAAIDAAIGKRLAEDEGLARRPEILTSIPDVSRVTAAGLLTKMPALGRLDAKEGLPDRPGRASAGAPRAGQEAPAPRGAGGGVTGGARPVIRAGAGLRPPVVCAAVAGDGAVSVACSSCPITPFMGPSPPPRPGLMSWTTIY